MKDLAEPSPAPEAIPAEAPTATDVTTAPSTEDVKPPSPEPAKPKTALEAAKEAIGIKPADQPTDDKPAEASPVEGKPETEPEVKPEPPKDEQAKAANGEDFKDVPFHKHPRFQQVLKRAKDAEAKLSQLGNVEELTSKAKQVDDLKGWIDQTGLAPEEFNAGLEIMALMRHDPLAALEKLKPYMVQLQQLSGEVLPKELQEKVDSQQISQEDAQALARARSEAAIAKQRGQTLQQQQEAMQQKNHHQQCWDAVNRWEEGFKKSDPDYSKKQKFITDRIRTLMQSNPPSSPDGYVTLCNTAAEQITAEMRGLLPKAPAVAAKPASTSSSITAQAKPRNAMEAAKLALQQTRA